MCCPQIQVAIPQSMYNCNKLLQFLYIKIQVQQSLLGEFECTCNKSTNSRKLRFTKIFVLCASEMLTFFTMLIVSSLSVISL